MAEFPAQRHGETSSEEIADLTDVPMVERPVEVEGVQRPPSPSTEEPPAQRQRHEERMFQIFVRTAAGSKL